MSDIWKDCDFKGCHLEATTTGHVYGHASGGGESDSFIIVRACAVHAKRDDFFPVGPRCGGVEE